MPFTVEVKFNVKALGPIVTDEVKRLATDISQLGKADIARAGRIGRFARGFRTRPAKYEFGHVVYVDWRPNFAKVFETGSYSRGKPLLWIPVSGKGRFRKFGKKLFRPKGKKILIGTKGKGKGKTFFVGVTSVTNRRRVHIEEIVKRETQHFAEHMATRAKV